MKVHPKPIHARKDEFSAIDGDYRVKVSAYRHHVQVVVSSRHGFLEKTYTLPEFAQLLSNAMKK